MFRIQCAHRYELFGLTGTMPMFCLHDGNGFEHRPAPHRPADGPGVGEPVRDTLITVMIENGHHHRKNGALMPTHLLSPTSFDGRTGRRRGDP